MKKVALLISRQAMFPSGKSLWIKETVNAIKWCKANNLSICSSTGIPTWEIITTMATTFMIPVDLYLICESLELFKEMKEKVCKDFNLVTTMASIAPVIYKSNSKAVKFLERDNQIINNADILIPISIRPNGNFDKLLRQTDKSVDYNFQTDYDAKPNSISYGFDNSILNPEIKNFDNNHLIHWTRTSNSEWPDEPKWKYYKDIVENENYPRTAFHTLKQIVSSKTVLASPRNMPKKTSCISLSNLKPTEIIPLIAWRSRYKQMSFEPYGIGIKKNLAEQLEMKPVIYYDKKNKTPYEPAWLTQSRGKKTDWSNELEYRHIGDFDLSKIDKNNLILFCYTPEEANELEQEFNIKAVSFLK